MAGKTRPITIGVAGGSGAGKTTITRLIIDQIGTNNIAYIAHDSYYRDLSTLPREQRIDINFDHPDSLDNDLFISHIKALQNYEAIEMPVYDFPSYTRTEEVVIVPPRDIILVEGILIFADSDLRDLLDIRIFVDTDDDVRLIRRIQRDIRERGRSIDSVINQWLQTVRPMHQQFVEPSRRHAHVIIPEGGYNTVALDMVIARIEAQVNQVSRTSHPGPPRT